LCYIFIKQLPGLYQQGAFGMATLEHLTFSELEKLIRALALPPDTRLTVTFDGEEPEL
jgi:hypothetical protein